MAKLLIQESNGAREFEIVDQEVSIGRELDNALRLADPSISRHHAMLGKTPDGYEIKDLGSSNGVLLNGAKVESGLLKDGDRITLGQLQLTFIDPQATERMPPPAKEQPNPLGTIRMDLDEMVKIQSGLPLAPVPPDPNLVPPPPPPPPAPRPAPAPAPAPQQATGGSAPPAVLQPYVPPVPDDAQPVMAGGGIERGGFGDRLLARLIDALVGFLLAVVFVMVSFVGGMLSKGLMACLGCALYPLLGIGYTVFILWCEVSFRGTIGKKIMKLRVVPEDNPGGYIDWGKAILRYLGHLVSGALFGLPYLLILGAERKGLQDMFSGSVVIKVDR